MLTNILPCSASKSVFKTKKGIFFTFRVLDASFIYDSKKIG
jgi:hypothetical protein